MINNYALSNDFWLPLYFFVFSLGKSSVQLLTICWQLDYIGLIGRFLGTANRIPNEIIGNKGNNLAEGQGSAKDVPKSVMDNALLAAENAICATFDFLNPDGIQRQEGDDSDEAEEDEEDAGSPFTSVFQRGKRSRKTMIPSRPPKSNSNEDMAQVVGDADTVAALKEFDFLATDSEGSGEGRTLDNEEWPAGGSLARMKEDFKNEQKDRRGIGRPKRSHLHGMLNNLKQEEDITDLTSPKYAVSFAALPDMQFSTGEATEDGSFALGELAALTVNNDTESGNYDVSG